MPYGDMVWYGGLHARDGCNASGSFLAGVDELK